MRLALIGTGLIGGSAAWAMKQAGIFTAVTACDLSTSALEKALVMGIADRTETSVAAAVADADAVMVAVPVLAMKSVFAEVARNAKQGTWITDVGLRTGASDRGRRNARRGVRGRFAFCEGAGDFNTGSRYESGCGRLLGNGVEGGGKRYLPNDA